MSRQIKIQRRHNFWLRRDKKNNFWYFWSWWAASKYILYNSAYLDKDNRSQHRVLLILMSLIMTVMCICHDKSKTNTKTSQHLILLIVAYLSYQDQDKCSIWNFTSWWSALMMSWRLKRKKQRQNNIWRFCKLLNYQKSKHCSYW